MSQKEKDVLENQQEETPNGQNILPHDEHEWADGWVPIQPAVGRQVLKFPDDTQIGVIGLDDIMAELYSENRPANDKTADEIINRLEAKDNYIPSSDRVRKEYVYALLREYRKYIKDRSENGRSPVGR